MSIGNPDRPAVPERLMDWHNSYPSILLIASTVRSKLPATVILVSSKGSGSMTPMAPPKHIRWVFGKGKSAEGGMARNTRGRATVMAHYSNNATQKIR
jgi:hypothetical protein